jgi:hypothetical protein
VAKIPKLIQAMSDVFVNAVEGKLIVDPSADTRQTEKEHHPSRIPLRGTSLPAQCRHKADGEGASSFSHSVKGNIVTCFGMA